MNFDSLAATVEAGIGKVGLCIFERSTRLYSSISGWYADPYASGEASYLSVRGLQSSGTCATSKHVCEVSCHLSVMFTDTYLPWQFIGYEQETFRNAYGNLECSLAVIISCLSLLNSLILF